MTQSQSPARRSGLYNHRSQSGQGMLEYILIVVFVVIASIALWRQFGTRIHNLVQGADSALGDICSGNSASGGCTP